MNISTKDHMPGWIPGNLNKGHLDRFYFLLAVLTFLDLVAYIGFAKCYKCIKWEGKFGEREREREMRQNKLEQCRWTLESVYKCYKNSCLP